MSSLLALYEKISTEKDYRLKLRLMVGLVIAILCPFAIANSAYLAYFDSLSVLKILLDNLEFIYFCAAFLAWFQAISGLLFWPLSFFVLKVSSAFYGFFAKIAAVWVDVILVALVLSELTRKNLVSGFLEYMNSFHFVLRYSCYSCIAVSFLINLALAIDWIQYQRKEDYRLLH